MSHRWKYYGRLFAVAWIACQAPIVCADEVPENRRLPEGALVRLGSAEDTNRQHGVYQIVYSPNGQFIATRSTDQIVRLYDSATGQPRHSLDGFEDGRVSDMIFSHDGKRLLVMSSERTEAIVVWEVASGRELRRLPYWGQFIRRSRTPGHFILAIYSRLQAFSLEDKDGLGQATPLSDSIQPNNVPLDCTSDFRQLLFYANRPVNRTGPHNAYLIDLKTSQNVIFPFETQVIGAAMAPHSSRLAAICRYDKRVHIRDRNKPSFKIALSTHSDDLQDVRYSPDGRYLATVARDGKVSVLETLTGQLAVAIRGHGDALFAVAFSPDGRQLATGSSGEHENCGMVWDLRHLLYDSRVPDQPISIADEFQALGSSSPVQASQVIGSMLRQPDAALEFLAGKVNRSVAQIDAATIAKLISQLDDPAYPIRSEAFQRLMSIRNQIRRELEDALAASESLEARIRLQRILNARAELMPKSEHRQWSRTVQVLELLASSRAIDLLQSLSRGNMNPEITDASLAALQRLSRQPTKNPES